MNLWFDGWLVCRSNNVFVRDSYFCSEQKTLEMKGQSMDTRYRECCTALRGALVCNEMNGWGARREMERTATIRRKEERETI